MFLRRTTIILTILLLAVVPVRAQREAVLQLHVKDQQGNPVAYPNAAVSFCVDSAVFVVDNGVMGDAKGSCRLATLTDTAFRLRIQSYHYQPFDTLMRLSGNAELEITMRTAASQLQLVRVTSEKTRTTTFTHINAERIERVAGPQGGVEGLLKTLPDVSSNNELSTQYSVRGGSFDENLVYINGVEIYRPLLVRTGQQEGTSIINPDLVSNILFSPGGFGATYGDRMASVLDIAYGWRDTTAARVSLSLLGASLSLQGHVRERFSYSLGLRRHSNRYLFRSLDTKGNYTTAYSDLQALMRYRASDKLQLQLLAIATHNRYGLIPESQSTAFGSFQESLRFDVFYEGQEADQYTTLLGALSAHYQPNEENSLTWTASVQQVDEAELYDILSQFWLYQVNVGAVGADGEQELFDRGVGSYLEHARNYLNTRIYSAEMQGRHYGLLGTWQWGLKVQHEQVRDRMREWKWVDSAGYAMPYIHAVAGDSTNQPQSPSLQLFCRANHIVGTTRLQAFVQRNFDYYFDHGGKLSFVGGVRLQGYGINFSNDPETGNVSNYQNNNVFDDTSRYNRGLLFSPRISLNFEPDWDQNILFRLAAGVYSQAPQYREYRFDDGSLNHAISPQKSYQSTATMDWNMRLFHRPFKFTADLYYKYITNLVPYRIDNLRLRYDANNDAVGYAAGLSLRLSGEVVDGLESWASLSLMKTQEDLLNDDYGWLARPTDQRISFKIFFQDYVPQVPFWRMSLNFIIASGLPFTYPGQVDRETTHTYPAYFRVDWGNTIELTRFERIRKAPMMRHVDDLLLTLEVFNLFDYHNVVSYIWVADYSNQYYSVPNYLTARQLNFKITVTF